MREQFSRTELLIGTEAVEKLQNSRVIVFGVGGVGGFTVEALVRAGVGSIDVVDNDEVVESNINRQIIATHKTVGMAKVDAIEQRCLDINPNVKITKHKVFYLPENADAFDFTQFDYIVDAIDTVSGKLAIVENANKANTPVISAMGAGNKLDPTQFEVADIYKTSMCRLAKTMRIECKKRGIKHLKCVYSKEETVVKGNRTPASISFVPSVAGLIIAGEVIKDLIK